MIVFVCLQTQSYSITELAPHQLVIVTITATNGAGTSNSSSAAQIRTGESGIECTTLYMSLRNLLVSNSSKIISRIKTHWSALCIQGEHVLSKIL